MDIIETISVVAGSVILLSVFLFIGFEGVTSQRKSKKNLVSALIVNGRS